MPKRKSLGEVAADQKKAKEARGLLASLAALIGVGGGKPEGKMSKRTETTKHTVVEEDDEPEKKDEEEEEEDTDSGAEEEEEEEESSSAAEEEEEESDSASDKEEEEEEEEGSAKRGKYEEEEESKALASAVARAYKSDAVRSAFLAALPKGMRDVGALYVPSRLAGMVRKATGSKTTTGAMSALSTDAKATRKGEERVIRKLAAVETKVRKIGHDRLKEKVSAIVDVAKSNGRAPTKELRAQLREYGMQHGAEKLTAFIATLTSLPKESRIPEADASGAPKNAPARGEQARMREAALSGLDEKERKQMAEIEAEKAKGANGTGKEF